MAEPVKNWNELAERLEIRSKAVGVLGGMNGLDEEVANCGNWLARGAAAS